MKFRNAHFRNLPMSDAVKITYFERLINEVTGQLIEELGQDVMRMTTRDWLLLPLLPIRLVLLPIGTLIEQRDVAQHNQKDCAIGYITYNTFILYWRRFDDFETKPYRWNET